MENENLEELVNQYNKKNAEILKNISESIQHMTQEDVNAINEKIAKYINEDKNEITEEDKSHD